MVVASVVCSVGEQLLPSHNNNRMPSRLVVEVEGSEVDSEQELQQVLTSNSRIHKVLVEEAH